MGTLYKYMVHVNSEILASSVIRDYVSKYHSRFSIHACVFTSLNGFVLSIHVRNRTLVYTCTCSMNCCRSVSLCREWYSELLSFTLIIVVLGNIIDITSPHLVNSFDNMKNQTITIEIKPTMCVWYMETITRVRSFDEYSNIQIHHFFVLTNISILV